MYIDIFNGDADGICALHQLRLETPVDSLLVTGIKRDISLLSKVSAGDGDILTVLDISLDKNREALISLLELGAEITYYDHHFAGEIPEHARLNAVIDTKPSTCTSLLVNQALNGKYSDWAVTAAFGDNLCEIANTHAKSLGYSEKHRDQIKNLGICINYNGYGMTLDDLYFHPEDLYNKIKPFQDPLDFIENTEAFALLSAGYKDDMAKAESTKPIHINQKGAVFILPNEKWSRRVSGVYSNNLANINPKIAHAVLTTIGDGLYQVSVRAPLETKKGAELLCRQFETGGGREAAAGINQLPTHDLDRFIEIFSSHF